MSGVAPVVELDAEGPLRRETRGSAGVV